MKKRPWLIALLIVVAVLTALLLARRDEVLFYIRLAGAYITGRRFYATYPHLTRDVRFHPDLEPRLDVYAPAGGTGHPVVVFFHGGSWRSYDKELFAPVGAKLVSEPLVVVIPDYTLYPDAGYEQMATEVAAAVSWVLDNIEVYGGDPGRVVVAGHSAGAHLGALAVMDARFLGAYGHSSDEICALVGLSGVYDVRAEADFWLAKGEEPVVIRGVMGGEANFETASPLHYVRPDLPPVYLIHGEEDETVPLSIATDFAKALQAAGARSQLTVYPRAGHTDYLFSALTRKQAPIVTALSEIAGSCPPAPRK